MNRASTPSILTVAGFTLLGGLVAYAAYFDYKRRNDPSFRRKIRTQKKKVDKAVAESKKEAEQANSALNVPREILEAVHEKFSAEQPPTNPDERHQFFVGVVATAERLAAEGPQNYFEAAIYFYQALRVYPSPMELITIYQKTVPEQVLAIVMELYNMDVSTILQTGGSGMSIGIDIGEAPSPVSRGPPSEASSQEWDKVTDPGSVIGHIQGYYKKFPPKAMNVSLQKVDSAESRGGQTRTHLLVAAKSFKAGDVIYKESPIVATLDPDLQGSGTHCSHCLREVDKDTAIAPESDRLGSVFCSEKCQSQCGTQSHDLLFSDKSPLPPEIAVDLPVAAGENRPKTQDALAGFWRQKNDSGLILVARLVAMQIIAELAKALPQAEHMKADLPELSVSGQYTVYDHMERLRYVDVSLPDGEYDALKNLLLATLPFLEDAHSDERHAVFRGKIAYNAIGIYHGEGREDRAIVTESQERTRIPIGTSKQIGAGLYFVSSYLSHSCDPSVCPSFNEGTSELHLVALRDIEEGEELTMAYVDVSQHDGETPVEAYVRRRAELSQGWKFACRCSRCEEDKKSLGLEGDERLEDGSKVDYDYTLKVHRLPVS